MTDPDWTFCYEAVGPVATDTAGLTYPRHFLDHLSPEMRARATFLLSEPVPSELDLRGVKLRTLGRYSGSGPGKALAAQLLVPAITRRMGVSTVFCSGSIASAFFGLSPKPRPRVVVNVQNAAPLENGVITAGRSRDNYRRAAVPAGLRHAEQVITTSETVGNALVDRYGIEGDRLSVIPLAAETDRFFPAPPGEDRYEVTGITGPYILFVSALWTYKNASALVEAYVRLARENGIEQLLVLCGKDGGDLENCREIAADAGMLDRVVFTGHTRDPRLPALYRHADLFVYPSLVESFGLPLLEAMASGAPVVASDRWAIPEVCGGAARICEPTPESLAEAMHEVLSSSDVLADLRARGLARAAEFSWERTVSQTVAVIRDVSLR